MSIRVHEKGEILYQKDHSSRGILTWISNYMPSKVWYEITHSFPNFNDCTEKIWEGISNFISHFKIYAHSLTDG